MQPSPDRITAPCPYYHQGCGGCQWQHVSYAAQLENKRLIVDREMERAGVKRAVDHVRGMEEPWRYRRTAAIAIGWEAGFRPRGRRGIVEIHDCRISHPLIGQLADSLNDVLRAGRLLNYHGKVWLDCTVVGSAGRAALQVVLQGIEGLTLESHPELVDVAEVLADLDSVEAVAFRHRSGEVLPLVGDVMGRIEVAGREMFVPAGAFFQTNVAMLELVIERMRGELCGRAVRQAADVYGGVGTFGLAIAGSVEELTLIELDAQAAAAAELTARSWGLSNVRCISSHAERALPGLTELDLAIVDPPRSGLGEVVVRALIEHAVPLIFYVSCSPQSLARDLGGLQGGSYTISALELFDFYPHTYHVEALAVLSR
jgi:23S rRNA (uracil1939-C5)-methyltransferase